MKKKAVVLILLFSMIAVPSAHALNLIERLIYQEVQIGRDRILVNKITGRVEKILVDNRYEPISTDKGWGGIPSDQDMYQAQYEKAKIL
jgi:hypothetical protein